MIRYKLANLLSKGASVLSAEPTTVNPRWLSVRSGPLANAYLYLDNKHGWARDFVSGLYDLYIFNALEQAQIPQNGSVVWDIGAFIGYYSLVFASNVGPNGRVIAFEPNPYNVCHFKQHLERNSSLAQSIQVVDSAISNIDEQQFFRCSSSFYQAPLGFLDVTGPPSDRIPRSTYNKFQNVLVQVNKADTLIRDGVEPPSLIKIDVEGAEALVLDGARSLLSTYRPALLIEVHNIKCMFSVQNFLGYFNYSLRFLEDPHGQSSSRAFVLGLSQ